MNLFKSLLPYLITLFIMYLVGAFITCNFNPTKWLIFTTVVGRIGFLLVVLPVLIGLKFEDED